MPKTYPLLLALILCAALRAADKPKDLLDQPIFKSSVGGSLEAHWDFGPEDPKELNKLINTPCFEYTKPYCMPKGPTEVGFVCSGQSAVVVTHLRSLGIKAAPFYLDWKNEKGGVEAHSMVIVPFKKGNDYCHHILEVARTWPHQPVVEFSHCYPGPEKKGIELSALLEKTTHQHFLNPPEHTAAREAADLPKRIPIPKDSPFGTRMLREPFDLKDPYNSDAPIWTLKDGKLACPKGLCAVHDVAEHMTIDQSKIDPDDSLTFKKTVIIVDYTNTQEFTCVQNCRAEDCILKQTGREAPGDLKVNWPPLRATCKEAAVLRSHLVNPAFSCKRQCEDARADYLGGFYKKDAKENSMKCSPSGKIYHRVHKNPAKGVHVLDGSEVPNRTIKKEEK